MKPIQNILVPVDFTEYSLYAVEVAAQIARQNNASITLIHIIDLSGHKYVGIDVDGGLTISGIIERYLYSLNRIKYEINQQHNTKIDVLLERGQIVSSILDKVKELKIDLMVIGTHGTEPRNFFLGINAFHIIKQSSCSVITIPKERIDGRITKLIFPDKIIHNIDEKCNFLESVVQEEDIVIEISGLNSGTNFNISVLNETIGFLENKFVEEHVKSIGELKNFVDVISDSLHDLNIELITVNNDRFSKQVPVLSIVHI